MLGPINRMYLRKDLYRESPLLFFSDIMYLVTRSYALVIGKALVMIRGSNNLIIGYYNSFFMHQLDSTILVTGGAGFIGSHICVELLISGFKVVVVDNLTNSSIESIERVKKITKSSVVFYQFDINSEAELDDVFIKHKIDAVIHLAGLKSVSESVSKAIQYYQNNISGTISLCNTMNKFGCKV